MACFHKQTPSKEFKIVKMHAILSVKRRICPVHEIYSWLVCICGDNFKQKITYNDRIDYEETIELIILLRMIKPILLNCIL